VSGVLPEKEAIALIKEFVQKQFARKGQEIVEMNWKAIDAALDGVIAVPIPDVSEKFAEITKMVPDGSGWFAENIVDPILRLKGDSIPVSAMPSNGAIPTGTKRLEYRGVPGNPATWVEKFPFVKEVNVAEPYIEYPPSCSGCGEVPYIHAVTQLFGDRMIIANATGCTSIYGGTFPLTPYTKDKNGKGPAWANSLFEDNAEFGMGMRLAVDANRRQLKTNVEMLLKTSISDGLKQELEKSLTLFDEIDKEAKEHAERVKVLLAEERELKPADAVLNKVIELQDYFVDKSIWIFGGDGWAYDIGFGGLDHVMASNKNVNILVVDTEVYSNTGGQASKSTPRGAVAKFASDGKKLSKKNLGLMMTTYSNAYVASVNMGMDREKTALAFVEAEKHNGPSIIIAYSPCIAHGYNMQQAKKQSEKASKSGYWPMYRFNCELREQGTNPFTWDGVEVDTKFSDYLEEELRYKTLSLTNPEEAIRLAEQAQKDNEQRFKDIKQLAGE
jgi:pyruvate-ferredoxin/flavodoxin oxidoreductase